MLRPYRMCRRLDVFVACCPLVPKMAVTPWNYLRGYETGTLETPAVPLPDPRNDDAPENRVVGGVVVGIGPCRISLSGTSLEVLVIAFVAVLLLPSKVLLLPLLHTRRLRPLLSLLLLPLLLPLVGARRGVAHVVGQAAARLGAARKAAEEKK